MDRDIKPLLKQEHVHPYTYISNGNLYKRALELFKGQKQEEHTLEPIFRAGGYVDGSTFQTGVASIVKQKDNTDGLLDMAILPNAPLYVNHSNGFNFTTPNKLNCEITTKNGQVKTLRFHPDALLEKRKEEDGTIILTFND